MNKRKRYNIIIPIAVILFATLPALNLRVSNCTARTNNDTTVIEHTQLEFFVTGKRIHMQASISDPAGIAEARLYFGASKDAKKLVFSTMKSRDGNNYVGIIPAPSPETKKIFYCLLAVNNNGNVTKTGLLELQKSEDLGFIPTWQRDRDLDERGKEMTLILGSENTESAVTETDNKKILTTGLTGFTDRITVNTADPNKRYLAAKNAQRVVGLSTIDGGDIEPSEETGDVKDEGLTRKQKIGIGAGVGALLIGGGIAAASGGGGGGGGDGETTTTTTTTTTLTGPTTTTTVATTTTTEPSSTTTTTESSTSTTTVTTSSSSTTTTLPEVPINASFDTQSQNGRVAGNINFDPNIGQIGDAIELSLCFESVPDLGDVEGNYIIVSINGENKEYPSCNTQGSCQLNCDLGDILKFSSTTYTLKLRVYLEAQGRVKLYENSLPVEFK